VRDPGTNPFQHPLKLFGFSEISIGISVHGRFKNDGAKTFLWKY